MSLKLRNILSVGVLGLVLPFVSSAKDFTDIIDTAIDILRALVPFIFALAVLFFLWGVFQYLIAKGAEDKAGATRIIVGGVIGLFVMTAVWGLVGLLSDTVDLDNSGPDFGDVIG